MAKQDPRSNEWYQKKARSEGNEFPVLEIPQDAEEVNKELLDPCNSELFQSPRSLPMDTGHDYAGLMSALGSSPAMQNLQNLSPSQLPALSSNLRFQRSDTPKSDADKFVAEAAKSVSDAMGRIMNSSNQRRMSHQTDEGIDITDPHADVRNQLLYQIFCAAWQRVSSTTGPAQTASDPKVEEDKDGWHTCKYCSKRTRRQCEMKYVFGHLVLEYV